MMNNSLPRLPRASKKHWAGFSPHPFIAIFHSLMLERGFSFSTDDKEGENLYWKKPLFTGYEASVWISPKNTKKNRPEAFGLFINLCVESSRQAFVDSIVRPWECINLREGNCVRPDGNRALVFLGFLDWLAERWDPVATSPEDGRGRWSHMKTQYAEEIAQDVISVFDRQGKDFFEYVGTPIKLANALLDPAAFPGRRLGENLNVSPSGIYPEESSAVLFHDAGLSDRAKAALEGSLHRIEAQVKAGRSDAMDVEIQKCKIERYLRWMETGDVSQEVVQVAM